jgi:TolA-binding protein
MYQPRIILSLAAAALLLAAPAVIAAPADDEYAAASALYSAHQWREASEAFSRFIERHPQHERSTVARFFRGESLAQNGKYNQAAGSHEEFLRLAPEHSFARVARFRVGECLLLAGKTELAKAELEAFRRDYPADDQNSLALPYLGEIALAAGKTAEAEPLYLQALHDYPTGPMAAESKFGLARCRQLTGKAADAVLLYEQVAADAKHPLADDARLQVGLLQYQAQRFAAAEESLSAFRTTFAESELAPQAWYWLGLSQQAAGRPTDAAATLAAAARQFEAAPEAAALHAAAGDAFRRAGDAAQADAHYQKLATQWPQSEWSDDALLGRAELALEAGEPDQASAIATELAERYPTSPHAGFAALIRARRLLAQEQFAEAATLLQPLADDENAAADEQVLYFLALAQAGEKKHEAALATLARLEGREVDAALADAVDEVRCTALLGLTRYKEAVELLQTRLAANGVDSARVAEMRVQLAVALAKLGDFAAAAAQIERLPASATADANVAGAALVAAEAAFEANQLRTAERLFGLVSQEHVPAEQRSHALSGLAWTQFRVAGKEASAATFDRLLREYPDSPFAAEAALLRARSLEDLKQVDAALATYHLVFDKYASSPQVPLALWGAARLHDKLQQDREAADLLTRLVEQHPKFAERDAALYQLGWVQADAGDAAAADAAHTKLVEEYPESEYWADAAYRLAEQAARRKETDRAISLAEMLLAVERAAAVHENALYLRGQLAAAEGNWPETAQFMGQHVERFPSSPQNLSARYWQAEAAFRQNDYAAAEQKFAALEAVSAGRHDAWLGIVPLRRAQGLAQQKRWPEALRMAESVRERYPQFPQLYDADYLIGRALGSQARFDEARAAYDRVLRSPAAKGTETAAMAQWMVGETYFHQKRYTAATDAYSRCLRDHEYPRWQAAALLQAGKCRLLKGEFDEARSDLMRVVSEYGDQPLAAEAKSRLAALDANPTPAASVAERIR